MYKRVQEVANRSTELQSGEINGTCVLVGYWDDLSPDPRRQRVRDELSDARRRLLDDFDVSTIEEEYGRAKIRITQES